MKSSVQPVPLLFFLSVVSLIASYWIYGQAGSVTFLAATALFSILIGFVIGTGWPIYPWQVGLLGAVPSALFIAWRFFTAESDAEAAENISLFVFHPLLVIVTCHFGALTGRWRAVKKKAKM